LDDTSESNGFALSQYFKIKEPGEGDMKKAGANALSTHCAYCIGGMLFGLGASSSSAAAVTDEVGSQQTPAIAEVVVTAQKIEQRLQDVPLSISAVTAADITHKDVTSLADLQYSVPGLSISGEPGQQFISIRGVSNANGEALVGEYIDEMAVTADKVELGGDSTQLDVRLLDMARVEVLRGPQGTLYGQGSMGGTIRYITHDPDLKDFSASLEGEGGSITHGSDSYKANGVVNLPLIQETLGLRLVAGYERDAGWIDDSVTGQSNINGIDFKTFRAKLLARPTDNLEISFLYLHQDTDQDYQDYDYGTYGVDPSAVESYNRDRYDLFNGIVKYDFGAVKVLETAGYLDRTSNLQSDLTGSFLPFLQAPPPAGFGLPPGFITQIPFGVSSAQRLLTDELRFSSQDQGRFNWTGGLYYRHSDADFNDVTSTHPGTLPFTLLRIEEARTSDSFAVFGEANYQLTSELNAIVGARFFHDREDADADSVEFGASEPAGGSATFHSFDPRFNLSYTFSPTSMMYVNAAEGFRSGGFNVSSNAPGIPVTFAPDHLWTYELGTKQQLFERKLELDGAVYYTDWSNVQSTYIVPNTDVGTIENTGKVSGWGTDLTMIARPVQGLTLTATYGWNNLAFKTATDDKDVGDPVDYAVRQSYSVSLDYRQPVFGRTTGFFHADYQRAGESQVTERTSGSAIEYFPAHSLVNLRAGFDFGRFETSIFATNVFNDRTLLALATPVLGVLTNTEQRPRTIGVNIKAHF
jgi:outer membrane receptor protein involved in Fe transport